MKNNVEEIVLKMGLDVVPHMDNIYKMIQTYPPELQARLLLSVVAPFLATAISFAKSDAQDRAVKEIDEDKAVEILESSMNDFLDRIQYVVDTACQLNGFKVQTNIDALEQTGCGNPSCTNCGTGEDDSSGKLSN